jgi:hypothetical protein
MMGNKLQAQVTFSGPTTINSGGELEITAVGETAAYHIGSMPGTGATEYTPFNGTVSTSLTYTSYFKSNNPTVPSRFKYKMENFSSVPLVVKITFMNVTIVNSENLATYNTNLKYTVTINPAPPVKNYYSSAKSGSFVKNDCTNADGPAGPAVIYNVPANKYTSTISQAAADALAVADLNANGQHNANIYGTCASQIRLTLSSPDSPDENGNYPNGTQVIATISFIGAAPAGGVKFEIEVRNPDQTVTIYEQNSVKLFLQQGGFYAFRARITKLNTGEVSSWISDSRSVAY